VGNKRAELAAKGRVMVHTGMPIGARDHACDQDTLEKYLPKREVFFKLQFLDSNLENLLPFFESPGMGSITSWIFLCSTKSGKTSRKGTLLSKR
jgi:hypothetical protein